MHGGNIRFYKEKYNLKNIIDFSANINPLGFPPSVEDIIIKSIPSLVHYPKCEENQTYLVVDEVFMGFVDEKKPILKNYLIVIRSFTKIFGLPGIRLGYCIANRQLIKRLNDLKWPWSVNSLALEIGEKIIKDKSFIKKTKDFIKNEGLFLYKTLHNIPFIKPYLPSANFILCEIIDKNITSNMLTDRLAREGILIRDCRDFKGLGNKFFRIAVRTREENLKLITCLQSYVHTY